MSDVFVSTLAFSLTMSVAAVLAPAKPIPAEPWLTDNFDRLDFKVCRECRKSESVTPAKEVSNQSEEENGFILIPNLKVPLKSVPRIPK